MVRKALKLDLKNGLLISYLRVDFRKKIKSTLDVSEDLAEFTQILARCPQRSLPSAEPPSCGTDDNSRPHYQDTNHVQANP